MIDYQSIVPPTSEEFSRPIVGTEKFTELKSYANICRQDRSVVGTLGFGLPKGSGPRFDVHGEPGA